MKELKELRDRIDELHGKINYYDHLYLTSLVDTIDTKTNLERKKLKNLIKLILDDADKRKEKIIAIDSETFKDVYGKEIRIKISKAALEDMEKYLEEIKKIMLITED